MWALLPSLISNPAGRNDRTRGHHSGERGFFGDNASYQNGPRQDAGQKKAAAAMDGPAGVRAAGRRAKKRLQGPWMALQP
jgi:hypothetical protein